MTQMIKSLEELQSIIIFETDHYDVPLKGLARIGKQIYSFESNKIDEYGYPVEYKLTLLTGRSKRKALFAKWWFEFCIGTYWSRDRKTRNYHPNRSRLLRCLLWRVFYGFWPPRVRK